MVLIDDLGISNGNGMCAATRFYEYILERSVGHCEYTGKRTRLRASCAFQCIYHTLRFTRAPAALRVTLISELCL